MKSSIHKIRYAWLLVFVIAIMFCVFEQSAFAGTNAQCTDGIYYVSEAVTNVSHDTVNLDSITSLKGVFIPSSVVEINDNTFSKFPNAVFFYEGTMSEWEGINFIGSSVQSNDNVFFFGGKSGTELASTRKVGGPLYLNNYSEICEWSSWEAVFLDFFYFDYDNNTVKYIELDGLPISSKPKNINIRYDSDLPSEGISIVANDVCTATITLSAIDGNDYSFTAKYEYNMFLGLFTEKNRTDENFLACACDTFSYDNNHNVLYCVIDSRWGEDVEIQENSDINIESIEREYDGIDNETKTYKITLKKDITKPYFEITVRFTHDSRTLTVENNNNGVFGKDDFWQYDIKSSNTKDFSIDIFNKNTDYILVPEYNAKGQMIGIHEFKPVGNTYTVVLQSNTEKVKLISLSDAYVSENKNLSVLVDNNSEQVASRAAIFEKFVEIMGYDTSAYSEADYPFKDCGGLSDSQKKAYAYCYKNGLIGDVDAANPDKKITRAEIAAILWKSMGEPAFAGEGHFIDVEKGTWYFNGVEQLLSRGVIDADTVNFLPSKCASVREACVWFERFAELVK